MKNIFKIVFLLTLVFVLSCDKNEQTYYDGNVNASRSFLSFTKSLYDLPVNIDSQNNINITLNVSTLSTSDRTYNIIVNQDETTADAMTYTIPSTIIVPAGSYKSTLNIVGMDNNLLGIGESYKIVLEVSGLSDTEDMDNNKVVVNLFQVCPFDLEGFVGTYAANEEGYCDGCYNVEVVLGADPNTLVLSNLYDVGGVTTIVLSENPDHIAFTGDYLYTSAANGDASAYDPSYFSGNVEDDISTFNTCTNYMDLYFRPCVSAGCFPVAHIQLTKN